MERRDEKQGEMEEENLLQGIVDRVGLRKRKRS